MICLNFKFVTLYNAFKNSGQSSWHLRLCYEYKHKIEHDPNFQPSTSVWDGSTGINATRTLKGVKRMTVTTLNAAMESASEDQFSPLPVD